MAKIDKQVVKRIAESYSVFALDFNVPLDDIEHAILEQAKRYGGCINCVYSIAPKRTGSERSLPILRRHCRLGLAQGACGMWKPIVEA